MKPATTDRPCAAINCLIDGDQEALKQEVYNGLSARQRYLPSKYFYDSRGATLFEQICHLPEYYQTRTELSILRTIAPAVMENLKEGNLIELGSGANWKIRTLLDAANGKRSKIRYVPVDVCEPALAQASKDLIQLYPELTVLGIVADITRDLGRIWVDGDKLIAFFGSTIGNFNEQESITFLRSVAGAMGPRDRFLVGMDMIKPTEILEAAYNDTQGITAEFNKNILAVMNCGFHANFDLPSFDHLAFYNEERACIEMHLRANRDVSVKIEDIGLHITLQQGETIFTEICRKFSREQVVQMAAEAGLVITRWLSDPAAWFSLVEMMSKR